MGRLCFGDSISCHIPQEADSGEAGTRNPSLGRRPPRPRARPCWSRGPRTQTHLLIPIPSREMIHMGQRGQGTDSRSHSTPGAEGGSKPHLSTPRYHLCAPRVCTWDSLEPQVSAEVSQGPQRGGDRKAELTSRTLILLPHFHPFYLGLTRNKGT